MKQSDVSIVCFHKREKGAFLSRICTNQNVEDKFHMEPQWDGGTKVCSQGPGLMTRIAAMPIYW